MHPTSNNQSAIQTVAIVVPVYQGEKTLPTLLSEIAPLTKDRATKEGVPFRVIEAILVHDGARDDSARVMTELVKEYVWVRTIWLSRNFGQHPATLAGMASTTAMWVATLDEDGQQHPQDIATLLDEAIKNSAQLVYAKPTNPPPHGVFRNSLSLIAKWFSVHILGNRVTGYFNSFRLIDGEIARSIAAYVSNAVFLDIALTWATESISFAPVTLRAERGRGSGYSIAKLLKHLWHLILTSGTRPLRFITVLGMLSLILALCVSVFAVYAKVVLEEGVQGWASMLIVVSFFSGFILFSLGIIAEYLAVALGIVMGRPLYLVVSKPPKRTDRTL